MAQNASVDSFLPQLEKNCGDKRVNTYLPTNQLNAQWNKLCRQTDKWPVGQTTRTYYWFHRHDKNRP